MRESRRASQKVIAGALVTSPAKVDACGSQLLSIREPDCRRKHASPTEKTFRRV